MAGDWIKMRCNLAEDPRIAAIAESLCIHELYAVGLLYRFWSWADQQLIDGNAVGVTENFIDKLVSMPGFTKALRTIGWLEGEAPGLILTRFNEHNGQTAKNRAVTARRVAFHKSKSNAEGNGYASKKVTVGALPREEKRREDSIPPVVPPSGGSGEGGDVPLPSPPVMVTEAMARGWLTEMIGAGAKFTDGDFQEAFRLLHGTRDVRTGAWRVGRRGLVSDPRVILEQRLHDTMGRRIAGRPGSASPTSGQNAFVLRQKITALESQLKTHKGHPEGNWPENVREAHGPAYHEKLRELRDLNEKLTTIDSAQS